MTSIFESMVFRRTLLPVYYMVDGMRERGWNTLMYSFTLWRYISLFITKGRQKITYCEIINCKIRTESVYVHDRNHGHALFPYDIVGKYTYLPAEH